MKKILGFVIFVALMVPAAAFSAAATEGSGADGPITFTFAEHIANVEDQAPQVWGAIQAFQEKYPNITIDLIGAHTADHSTRMKLAAQSNTLPDLFWVERGSGLEMVQAGRLADLTDVVEADAEFKNGFLPNMTQSLAVDGRIYGLPSEIQCNGIWYNKALFDKFGLEVPTTFDEFVEVTKVFSANDVVTMAMGSKDPWSNWVLQTWHVYFGFNDRIGGILAGTDKWNNPDFVKVYDKVAQLRDLGAFPESVTNMDYWQAIELFLGGKAAMLNSGAWETKKFEQSDLAEHIYFYWGPTFGDGVLADANLSMKGVGHPYVVAQRTQEQNPDVFDAVIKYLKFYYGPEGTQIVAGDNQSIPVTYYRGEIDADKYPVFARMIAKINDDTTSPVRPPDMMIPAQLVPLYQESFYAVITDVVTPLEALDNLDKFTKDILQ